MDLAGNDGPMAQYMKGNGSTTKQKAKANLHIQMETTTRENGLMIKQMVTEFTYTTKLELNMKAIGKMTCNMGQEYRSIATETNMKECSNKAEEVDKAHTITQLDKYIRAAGQTAELKASGFVNGQTVKSFKGSGWIIKSMVKEYTLGRMVENMRETTATIKNMAKALILGQMVGNTSGNGRMISVTGGGPMSLIVSFKKKVFGKKIDGLNGWRIEKLILMSCHRYISFH